VQAVESIIVTTFQDLGVSAPILKALDAEGYTKPTPIQMQALPIVAKGKDLIGLAQTGTGKTAAFALPILDRLHKDRKFPGEKACRTLVLAPTRELAAQIGDSFRAYGKFLGLSTAVVFGGASMHKQKQAMFRGVDVLVATPGRLLDHVSQRSVRLDKVEILVLDEADRMLDMGFIHDLRKIATILPRQRQTLFFSATMPPAIEELAAQFLDNPEKVSVAPQSTTAERVQQAVVHVDQSKKQDLLHAMLADKSIKRALVFARTKHGADRVVKKLESAGFNADAIHGNKSQGQRIRALDGFKKGATRILVATEVAARGIDVDDITHVINYDLPNVPEQYVHRIGRTARAGTDGIAISYCAPDERAYLRDIEKLTKQPVPVLEPTPPPRALAKVAARKAQPGAQVLYIRPASTPAKHHASEARQGPRQQGHARRARATRVIAATARATTCGPTAARRRSTASKSASRRASKRFPWR
jgi:ATP-dependent RNA helicase RhlE